MKLQVSGMIAREIHINFIESHELCLDKAGETSVLALERQRIAGTHKKTTVSVDGFRSLRNQCNVEVR